MSDKVAITLRRDAARPCVTSKRAVKSKGHLLASEPTLRQRSRSLENRLSGFISTERDGHFERPMAATKKRPHTDVSGLSYFLISG